MVRTGEKIRNIYLNQSQSQKKKKDVSQTNKTTHGSANHKEKYAIRVMKFAHTGLVNLGNIVDYYAWISYANAYGEKSRSWDQPRKFKGGICCGGHLVVTYGAELLYLRIFSFPSSVSNQ